MEANLTIEELYEIAKAAKDRDWRLMKFQAALKGVNLDEGEDDKEHRFNQMKHEAEAKASGRNVDEVRFQSIGIKVISELE